MKNRFAIVCVILVSFMLASAARAELINPLQLFFNGLNSVKPSMPSERRSPQWHQIEKAEQVRQTNAERARGLEGDTVKILSIPDHTIWLSRVTQGQNGYVRMSYGMVEIPARIYPRIHAMLSGKSPTAQWKAIDDVNDIGASSKEIIDEYPN